MSTQFQGVPTFEDPLTQTELNSAMPALNLFHSDNRGADFAQSSHELGDHF
jgi:hypothetical protein